MGRPPMESIHIPVLNCRRVFASHKCSVIITEFPLLLLENPIQILRVTLSTQGTYDCIRLSVYSQFFSEMHHSFMPHELNVMN